MNLKLRSLALAASCLVAALVVAWTIQSNLPSGGALVRANANGFDVQSPPAATFSWSMPERFGPMKNGLVDYHWNRVTHTYDPAFVNPSSWRVDFDACDSSGGTTNVRSYTWEILGETIVRAGCKLTYDKFKFLGTYPVKLTVTEADGQSSSYQEVINVRDIVIVSIGDSFASGQGNPDINRDKETKAQWIYSRCHRSAKAAPALAARRIEEADPHSSVTFVSYACSGARIDGLTGKQKKGVKNLAPQIDKVRQAVTGRNIDALLISIGGNDLNFATLVARAIAYKHTQKLDRTKELFMSGLESLPEGFVELRDSIGKLFPTPKVFITEYPNLVTDAEGKYCNEAPKKDLLQRITADEAEWASDTVINNLNCEVRRAAETHRWVYVGGIEASFLRHGYCAGDEAWVNTFDKAREVQGTSRCRETSFGDCIVSPGSVHPNVLGHKCLATRILLALQANGVATDPNLIRPTDPCVPTPPRTVIRPCLLDTKLRLLR